MKNEELIKLRIAAGLTQAQLADFMKKKRVTISAWEVGRRNPSTAAKKKLAEFFDVSVNDLFFKELKKDVVIISTISKEDRDSMIATLMSFSKLPLSYYESLSDRKIIEDYDRHMNL